MTMPSRVAPAQRMPGTEGKAHSQNETVLVEDLVKGAKVVAAYLADRLAK